MTQFTGIKLYRLVDQSSGLPYGHAIPMMAAVRAKKQADSMGKPCYIVRAYLPTFISQ